MRQQPGETESIGAWDKTLPAEGLSCLRRMKLCLCGRQRLSKAVWRSWGARPRVSCSAIQLTSVKCPVGQSHSSLHLNSCPGRCGNIVHPAIPALTSSSDSGLTQAQTAFNPSRWKRKYSAKVKAYQTKWFFFFFRELSQLLLFSLTEAETR